MEDGKQECYCTVQECVVRYDSKHSRMSVNRNNEDCIFEKLVVLGRSGYFYCSYIAESIGRWQ